MLKNKARFYQQQFKAYKMFKNPFNEIRFLNK